MKKKLKKLALKKNAVSHLQEDAIVGGAATAPASRCNCAPPATHRCTDKSKCCKYV